MTMSVQEISDRFEIMDLLTAYCSAIDTGNIDAFDSIFTNDAQINYSKAGGPNANVQVIKKFLKENLGNLPRQHMISNHKIKITGDLAEVSCLCLNPLELPTQNNTSEVMLWGLWYNDILVRTNAGWRIQQRTTEPCYNWKIQRVL